jgi:hypothetical protein
MTFLLSRFPNTQLSLQFEVQNHPAKLVSPERFDDYQLSHSGTRFPFIDFQILILVEKSNARSQEFLFDDSPNDYHPPPPPPPDDPLLELLELPLELLELGEATPAAIPAAAAAQAPLVPAPPDNPPPPVQPVDERVRPSDPLVELRLVP